ncbi:hypothetical protein MTO96_022806 [Rhipicephalus appendiculatus]
MNPFLYFMQIVLFGSTGRISASVDVKKYGIASTDFPGRACADGLLCYFGADCDEVYPPPSSTSSTWTTIRDVPSCNFFSGHVSCSPTNMNPFLYFMQIVLFGSTGRISASVDVKKYGIASTDFPGRACADGLLCYFGADCDEVYPPPQFDVINVDDYKRRAELQLLQWAR